MGAGAHELPFGFDDVAALLGRAVDLGRPGPGRGPSLTDVSMDLSRLGLPAGSAVIMAFSNGRRLLDHYFATLLAGAVPLLVPPATSSDRIRRLAGEVGAGAVIAARLEPRRFGVDAVVPVGDAEAVQLPCPEAPSGQPGTVLMATSGTSGMFSACLHRVESLARNARRHVEAVGLRDTDTLLVSLPLVFSYAMVAQAFAALVTGARLVISGPPFSPAAYVAALAQHGVTSSSVTPTIARLLLAQQPRLPTGLRMLTVGGDGIAPGHVAELLSINPHLALYLTYGLTEAGPRVSTLAAHREPARRYGSVGRPLTGVTTTLRPVPGPGGGAELLVASDTVMIAKVGGAAAERTLIAPGVVATGDLFRIDDDGYLYFEDRLSDFAVIRGEKVSLYAVRQLVQSLPGVVRCTTRLGVDEYGASHFDLDILVADDAADAEPRLRRALGSFLLPSERPRSIAVDRAELAVFQK